MQKYTTGQIVEGKVTGIQPYGAFVSLDGYTSGLIHISEISEGYVKDITQFVNVGETVKVKIIDFDTKTNQARLSLKALHKTRVRNRRRTTIIQKASLPEGNPGFRTIQENMPRWIEEAKKNHSKS